MKNVAETIEVTKKLPQAMSVQQVEAALGQLPPDPAYRELVRESAVLVREVAEGLLDSYYRLGELVDKATGGREEGDMSVPEFTKHLHIVGGVASVSVDSVYNALHLYKGLNKTQVTGLKNRCVALRNVVELCKPSVPEPVRNQMVQDVVSGAIPQQGIRDEIRKRIGKGAPGRSNNRSAGSSVTVALRGIRGMPELAETFRQKMVTFGDNVAEICRGDDEEAMRTANQITKETSEQIDAFVKSALASVAKAEKALQRVAEVLSKPKAPAKKAAKSGKKKGSR